MLVTVSKPNSIELIVKYAELSQDCQISPHLCFLQMCNRIPQQYLSRKSSHPLATHMAKVSQQRLLGKGRFASLLTEGTYHLAISTLFQNKDVCIHNQSLKGKKGAKGLFSLKCKNHLSCRHSTNSAHVKILFTQNGKVWKGPLDITYNNPPLVIPQTSIGRNTCTWTRVAGKVPSRKRPRTAG